MGKVGHHHRIMLPDGLASVAVIAAFLMICFVLLSIGAKAQERVLPSGGITLNNIELKADPVIDLDIEHVGSDASYHYLKVRIVNKTSANASYRFGIEFCKPPNVSSMTYNASTSNLTMSPVATTRGWCNETGGQVFRLLGSSSRTVFGREFNIRVPRAFENLTIYYGSGTGTRALVSIGAGYWGRADDRVCDWVNTTFADCVMLDDGADTTYFNITYDPVAGNFTLGTAYEFSTTSMVGSAILHLSDGSTFIFAVSSSDTFWTYRLAGNVSWSSFDRIPGFDGDSNNRIGLFIRAIADSNDVIHIVVSTGGDWNNTAVYLPIYSNYTVGGSWSGTIQGTALTFNGTWPFLGGAYPSGYYQNCQALELDKDEEDNIYITEGCADGTVRIHSSIDGWSTLVNVSVLPKTADAGISTDIDYNLSQIGIAARYSANGSMAFLNSTLANWNSTYTSKSVNGSSNVLQAPSFVYDVNGNQHMVASPRQNYNSQHVMYINSTDNFGAYLSPPEYFEGLSPNTSISDIGIINTINGINTMNGTLFYWYFNTTDNYTYIGAFKAFEPSSGEAPPADTSPPSVWFAAPTDENETVTANYSYVNVSLNETGGGCLLDWKDTPTYSESAGFYTISNVSLIVNPENYNDTNWGTYSQTTNTGSYAKTVSYYMNYTAPATANTASVWMVRYGYLSNVFNLSINGSCFGGDKLELRADTWQASDNTYWWINFTCKNVTSGNWLRLHYNYSSAVDGFFDYFHEEGVYWMHDTANESMSGSGTVFYLNKTALNNGNYTFRAWCNDTAGNLNVTNTNWVYVNFTASAVPAACYYTSGKRILVPSNCIYPLASAGKSVI